MNSQSNVAEIPQQSAPLETHNSLNDWQKLPDFLKQYHQFTDQQMRWLLLHREVNGLSEHVRKIGKPLYIHVPGFLQWIFDRKER